MQRRHFLEESALILGATALQPIFGTPESSDPVLPRPKLVFSKFLEKLSPEELATRISKLPVTGLEAPLRKGGHIEPGAMADKLPALVEALAQQNLRFPLPVLMLARWTKKEKRRLICVP